MSRSEVESEGRTESNVGSKLQGNESLWADGVSKEDPDFGSSNFNALPAGSRSPYSGSFSGNGTYTSFWTSTENPRYFWGDEEAISRGLGNGITYISRQVNSQKTQAKSVRCVRD